MTARQKEIETLRQAITWGEEVIKKFLEERTRELREIENGERSTKDLTWTHEDVGEAKWQLAKDKKRLKLLLAQEAGK